MFAVWADFSFINPYLYVEKDCLTVCFLTANELFDARVHTFQRDAVSIFVFISEAWKDG